MRIRPLAAVLAGAVLALSPAADADPSTRLDAKHREVVLTGHLEGASTYGPFYPVGGDAFDRTCVDRGCEEHDVVIAVPARTRARLDWSVRAPATGPGVDLRIFDADGRTMTRRSGGSIDTPSPTTATHGSVRAIPSGRYTVRVSVMAGVTDYAAQLSLYLY